MKYENLSKVLRGGLNAQVLMRLSNMQTVCLVKTPRRIKAYLVRPAINGGEARALLVGQVKTSKRDRGSALCAIIHKMKREFPEGQIEPSYNIIK